MADELNIRGAEEFTCKANDVLTIYLVKNSANLKELSFQPEFTHQIFGDEELIHGYKKLTIELYFTPSLKCWLNIKYKEKYDGSVTNIEQDLAEWLPRDYTPQRNIFGNWVYADEDNFKPIGTQIHQYTLEDPTKTYIITMGDTETEGLRAFHERIQTFAIFEIDAARYLDDDPRWEFFYLFEKTTVEGKTRFAPLGYVTWYKFFHYPNKIRPRISQFLILPPYQRMGHGRRLYETVFQNLVSRNDVADLAVEDPAEGFQAMRTLSDLEYLTKKQFVKSPPLDFLTDKGKFDQLQKATKLSPKQLTRCLEILALRRLKGNKIDEKKLKLQMKRRFFKEDEGLGAVEKTERCEKLAGMCDDLIKEYKEIIKKLSG